MAVIYTLLYLGWNFYIWN